MSILRLLSMGFTQPVHVGLVRFALGVEYDAPWQCKSKVQTNKHRLRKLFAAGDAEKGASLVVHAIEAGKLAAQNIDAFLRQ
jgi:glutamate synthase (NADPH) small chain